MKIISDSSGYSRANLGEAFFGNADGAHARNMEQGSDALLRAIWRRHPRIMHYAAKAGRNVVVPGVGFAK